MRVFGSSKKKRFAVEHGFVPRPKGDPMVARLRRAVFLDV